MEINTFWRLPVVERDQGLKKSAINDRIHAGLFPKPVSLGGNAVAWVASEIRALNSARIAGKSDAEIRILVEALESARRSA